jgi:hypothetical protein
MKVKVWHELRDIKEVGAVILDVFSIMVTRSFFCLTILGLNITFTTKKADAERA